MSDYQSEQNTKDVQEPDAFCSSFFAFSYACAESERQRCQDHHPNELVIGCLNPTGVIDKSSILAELPRANSGHTVWAVSGTHLSKPGLQKFNRQLAFHKTGMQAQMGAPVPLRTQTTSAIGGKHRGVGFLTTTPHRAMTPTWPEKAWHDNRFHVACFQVGREMDTGRSGIRFLQPIQKPQPPDKKQMSNANMSQTVC